MLLEPGAPALMQTQTPESLISDPMAVTKGIAEALITTAYGLVTAIITLIPFNIYQSRYQRAAEEMESVCSVLEIVFEQLPDKEKASKA